MEDAATAEIARVQLWQWLHQPDTRLDDGHVIVLALFDDVLGKERERLVAAAESVQQPFIRRAAEIVERLTHAEKLEPFLTTVAYVELD
jgi:malate synthase